ncbi:hypothetical protein N7466_000693 [Penicillium verhagenii]|uniref:uncharacterized protein n=1 Tax=Penicillium verhagenii TaxID=1562060 RepID=UPI0025455B72|nr:uncharacterized protein N7466_000693 [Penicillium verhagenii]KAJ5947678.1 hypothetical protein N7466_000693 [Penicillium verhagenii]
MAAPNNDHWTQKAEVPSGDEIMGLDNTQDEIVLPSNRPLGPWTSVVEYLGTHYQLFREEAIAPLRDAVAYLRESPGMKDSKTVSIYDKGHLVRVTAATRGLAFRIRFSTERAGKKIIWPHSSRLVPGSLVALSPANDMFSTKCMVATVASRALENVTKYPPEIDIYFACPDDIDIDSQQEWVMVEAKEGYFEASRYTLTALQKMVKEKFPLSQFICGLDTNVAVAENAKMKQFMNFQHLTGVAAKEKDVHSILDLPDTPMGSLNILQWQAMKEILTKKITLIQGPPGTGKTHVSVAALQVLLQSMVKGDPPIIIAAHTNHAVDQLLKLVSTSEPNYIRLGGRTTDLQIVEKTLYNIKRSRPLPRFNYSFRDLKKETYNLASLILAVFKPLQPEINGNIISASTFLDYGVLTTEQVESLKFEVDLLMGWNDHKESEPLACWIDEHAPKTLVDYGEECTSFLEDDMDRMDEAKQGYDAEDRDTLSGKSAAFDAMFSQRDNDSVTEDTIRAHLQGPDLCQIPSKLRGPTYKYLRGKLIQILNENVRDLAKRYNEACKSFAVARLEGDCEILRSAKLIAMTTTGLSKYRDLVASLKPRIVMIEEAAEVLEGPVTAACMESVEQLILVGDHKQLRGHCALPDLTGPPFHLDLSMFERLIGNNMPYIMLREQRRMVPEIRELLHPIYGELHDHRSVREYPPIPGMGNTRTFFFTHRWPEQGDSFSSKLNEMEGAMVVELCVWLILNGTPGNKITILTFYNGQRTTIFKLMRRHKHSLLLKSTNIVTVDSYQGEENEIILASLVRSNSNQSIGFLGVDNRVCVALSRAKRGFFLFGNAEVLASSSPLWKQVLSIMMADLNNLRVGRTFPLTCKSHGRPIYISGKKLLDNEHSIDDLKMANDD